MIRWLLMASALALASCGHVPPPAPPYPALSCDAACATFSTVCPKAEKNCASLCGSVADNDQDFPGCIAKATSCDQGNACDRGSQQQ